MGNIGEVDRNLAVSEIVNDTEVNFFNVRSEPFLICGLLTSRTSSGWEDTLQRREIILQIYENAVKRGDHHVFFIDGSTVFQEAAKLGVAPDSCTVDGTHPNDLGFACIANVFGYVIKEALIQ